MTITKRTAFATAAAAMLTAGTVLAQQNDDLASAMTFKKENSTTLTLTTTYRACTSDARLVTIAQSDVLPVIETRRNRITPEELRAAEDAYRQTTGPLMDQKIHKLIGFMSSDTVQKIVDEGRNPIGKISSADIGGPDNLRAMADLIKAQAEDMAAAQQSFNESVAMALDGHLYDPSRSNGVTAKITAAPAPECTPRP